MNRMLCPRFLTLLTALTIAPALYAQVTFSPKVARQSSPDLTLKRAELTESYTVLTFEYREGSRRKGSAQATPPKRSGGADAFLKEFLESIPEAYRKRFGESAGIPKPAYNISFEPGSRLLAPVGSVRKSFGFIKARGIPTAPERRDVLPGDRVEFTIFFERLPPGVQEFDLDECRSEGSYTCWNFYGVRINNPARRKPAPRPKAPAAPSVSPALTPAPKENPDDDRRVLVTGQVYDALTKQPIDAQLAYQLNGQAVETARTIKGMGIYRLRLNPAVYQCKVTATGYEPLDDVLDLTNTGFEIRQVDRDVYLKPATPKPAPADTATQPKPSAEELARRVERTPPEFRPISAPPDRLPDAKTPPPAAPQPMPMPGDRVEAPTAPTLKNTPLEVGRKVTLENLIFETSKSDLRSESSAQLNELADWLKANAKVEIRLEGHTDPVGDPKKNLQLSFERALAVKRYLMSKGIIPTRIKTIGYGDTRPVSTGTTEEDRRQNRRVELQITKTK